MTIEEFTQKLKKIKAQGYIPTKRQGPTGIGYTLEELLGMGENNIALPDLARAELKTHRDGSGSMITLFTFNNKVWQIEPIEAVRKYGSYDKNGRRGLYYTMSLKPNSAGLFLEVGDEEIGIRHISGEKIAVWKLEQLEERFEQKIPALILVHAFFEERDGKEYFHYDRASLLQGTSPSILKNQFKKEHLLVDVRMHDKGTRGARNHGTAFRVKEDKLSFLFERVTDLGI